MRTLALLLIATMVVMVQLAAADKVGCERRDRRCGPSVDCSLCDHGRCCSGDGYCGAGDNYCGLYSCLYQCPFSDKTCVPDTKSYSSVEQSEDFAAERANCAAVNRVNMSMGWIQGHGPTVFCARKPAAAESNGTIAAASRVCGKCLKITKRETGTQTIVRLSEDECSTNGPMLGNAIFQDLDNDGKGAAQGYLTVEYQSVPCVEA